MSRALLMVRPSGERAKMPRALLMATPLTPDPSRFAANDAADVIAFSMTGEVGKRGGGLANAAGRAGLRINS
ncbi:MAG: hypothetical protein JWO56_3426 [Acidobacteria bacterium]|nr:hypothetical protein [Acidobacteriota bacterium]